MQRIVEAVLERLLGTYIDGLSKEHLSVSLRKGTLELRSLRLKISALEELRLPILVKEGFLKSLNVQFKIMQLGTAPVKIFVISLCACLRCCALL